ncbi:hypothetical protein [Actibacterium sp.]|uniref:hypothetical protein n=1 Tax=Actibacterium sp. TaxID=1872125 RepID=UPI003564B566
MRKILLGSVVALVLGMQAAVAQAVPKSSSGDPTISVGVTWVFGRGVAFGAKVFSTDRSGRGAVSAGLDYLFTEGTWRPNLGAAYLQDGAFVDTSIGFGSDGFDFGVGIGPVNTRK